MTAIPQIKITNVSFSYDHKQILDGIHITISPKKWIGLIGPSGCGKSTLLRLLAGLLPLQEGSISTSNGLALNEQIAYMAQSDLLLPWLTVRENAMIETKFSSKKKHAHTIDALLKAVALEDAAALYPHALSGGMRQRVALVRTLLQEKPVILMDEPFSALDAITRFKLQNLTCELLNNKTVFFITHDPLEALRLADEIYLLSHNGECKRIASLTSVKPRDLHESEVLNAQADLYKQLTQAMG